MRAKGGKKRADDAAKDEPKAPLLPFGPSCLFDLPARVLFPVAVAVLLWTTKPKGKRTLPKSH